MCPSLILNNPSLRSPGSRFMWHLQYIIGIDGPRVSVCMYVCTYGDTVMYQPASTVAASIVLQSLEDPIGIRQNSNNFPCYLCLCNLGEWVVLTCLFSFATTAPGPIRPMLSRSFSTTNPDEIQHKSVEIPEKFSFGMNKKIEHKSNKDAAVIIAGKLWGLSCSQYSAGSAEAATAEEAWYATWRYVCVCVWARVWARVWTAYVHLYVHVYMLHVQVYVHVHLQSTHKNRNILDCICINWIALRCIPSRSTPAHCIYDDSDIYNRIHDMIHNYMTMHYTMTQGIWH